MRSHRSSQGSQHSQNSQSYGSGGSVESWTELERPQYEEEDEIDPSDSASRSRPPSSTRGYHTEARPAPTRRHSSRRITREQELIEEEEDRPRRRESSRRHHHSRRRHRDERRVPSDESSSTVASSHDDYPYGHHGGAQYPPHVQPPHPGYRHVRPPPSHGGYPPSIITSASQYQDPYAAQALVHMPQQDAFGYPPGVNNPFSPQSTAGSNPFSPMSTNSATSYFQTDPHAPPMPHQARPQPPGRPMSYMAPSSAYGSEIMSPYQHPAMQPYPGYMMPGMHGMHGMQGMPGIAGMPGYPPFPGYYPPPSTASSPPPQEDKKKEDGLADIKELIRKQEEARLAWEKEIIAKREAEAAEIAARKAKEEEEKKKKEEIAAASKKAKEDAEKKAEEAAKKAQGEHEKKLKEAETAKEEAEKKQKELEEEKKKLTPAPDSTKAPIRFKDAVGRKFSFPFHLCKSWKGMESLIKQAFLHVDVLGEHVHQGHYDLMGPDGEIILPQVWDTMIEPDWEISMHMWPMPEDEPDILIGGGGGGGKKKDKLSQDAAMLMDPFASLGLGGLGDLGIVDPGKKKPRKSDSKKKKPTADGIINVPSMGPIGGAAGIPPPPAFPPGLLADPLGMAGVYPSGIVAVEDPKAKGKAGSTKGKAKNGTKSSGGLASWFAGSSGGKSQAGKKR